MTKVVCAAVGCKHCSDEHICTLKKIRISENCVHTVYDGVQRFNRCKEYEPCELEKRFAELTGMSVKPKPRVDMTALRSCPQCGSYDLVYTQSGIDTNGTPTSHSIKCRICDCSIHGTTQSFVFTKWNEIDRSVDNFQKPPKNGRKNSEKSG